MNWSFTTHQIILVLDYWLIVLLRNHKYARQMWVDIPPSRVLVSINWSFTANRTILIHASCEFSNSWVNSCTLQAARNIVMELWTSSEKGLMFRVSPIFWVYHFPFRSWAWEGLWSTCLSIPHIHYIFNKTSRSGWMHNMKHCFGKP